MDIVYFHFLHFLQKLKKLSEGATTCLFHLPIQAFVAAIMKIKVRAGTIFCNCDKNLMMGTPRTGDKGPFKTNNSFNSTMMASFLPVIVGKKNKQTKKNISFIAVYHKFI